MSKTKIVDKVFKHALNKARFPNKHLIDAPGWFTFQSKSGVILEKKKMWNLTVKGGPHLFVWKNNLSEKNKKRKKSSFFQVSILCLLIEASVELKITAQGFFREVFLELLPFRVIIAWTQISNIDFCDKKKDGIVSKKI